MLRFERFEGPYGIPIFYMRMPEIIKASAMALVNFVGSADDLSVAEPGLYHWFEHVPFRGTKKFPGGYRAVKGPVLKAGGSVGAWTNRYATTYHATLPTRHLRLGMEVVFDLVAQPLLEREAIVAEREIIKQEIGDKLGSAGGFLSTVMLQHLWPDHPTRFSVLGTPGSLDSITPEVLHEARSKGYDRSRMAFFIATRLSVEEVLAMSSDLFELLPSNGLSERRRSASFGPLPEWQPRNIIIETEFSDTVMHALFPHPPVRELEDTLKFKVLRPLFCSGLGSPLYRAVREDNQLAYQANMSSWCSADGGYWGFYVSTSRTKVPQVEEALAKMLQDLQLRSRVWREEIHTGAINALDMEIPSPRGHVNNAVSEVSQFGSPYVEEELIEMVSRIPHEQILSWLDEIDFSKAITVIALGK